MKTFTITFSEGGKTKQRSINANREEQAILNFERENTHCEVKYCEEYISENSSENKSDNTHSGNQRSPFDYWT